MINLNHGYGKKNDDGVFEYAPEYLRMTVVNQNPILDDNGEPTAEVETSTTTRLVLFPSEDDYRSQGYLPAVDVKPALEKGDKAEAIGWEEVNGKWVRQYSVIKKTVTQADYDAAMEAYIKSVRDARGYTSREPSAYANSSNPRFKRDAEDWQRFLDEVMEYALVVINQYATTGVAPSIDEFIASMPQCVWTYELVQEKSEVLAASFAPIAQEETANGADTTSTVPAGRPKKQED